jgi:hypothetical protein
MKVATNRDPVWNKPQYSDISLSKIHPRITTVGVTNNEGCHMLGGMRKIMRPTKASDSGEFFDQMPLTGDCSGLIDMVADNVAVDE